MKNKLLKWFSMIALVGVLSLGPIATTTAQCPMCRMSAESNLKNGGQSGKGLNNGILYMLATPYLIVGLLGYIWWRNRLKEEEGQA